jgi:hypothetical protein
MSIRWTVALLAATLAGSVAAQNVQDKSAPQNPKDTSQASPSGQGATPDAGQAGGGEQKKMHKRKHAKHHKKSDSGSTGNAPTEQK